MRNTTGKHGHGFRSTRSPPLTRFRPAIILCRSIPSAAWGFVQRLVIGTTHINYLTTVGGCERMMSMRARILGITVFALIAFGLPLVAPASVRAAPTGDDFNSPTLDSAVWDEAGNTFGGAFFQYTGAQAALSVPSGSLSYQPWTSGNNAPTLRQSVANEDFDLVTVFATAPSRKFQLQGLVVADATSKFLRFDVHWDGSAMRAFAADPLVSSNSLINTPVPNSSHSSYLRVKRTGDTWDFMTSPNGTDWTSHGTFVRAMTVTELGPFVGNAKPAGGSAPAYSGLIDYFGPLPIPPGATGPSNDATPPDFDNFTIIEGPISINLEWSGNEPVNATATLNGSATQSPPSAFPVHSIEFAGLSPGTTYALKVVLTDLNGNASVFNSSVTTLGGGAAAGPIIDVWHGEDKAFGELGTSQRWVNIVGRLSDPDGVAERGLTYALNGGVTKAAGLGPNERRLVVANDFNIDIERSALLLGENTVLLTAIDSLGNTSSRVAKFTFTGGNVWPFAYGIDWSSVVDLQDHVDVVDGRWQVTAAGLRTSELGYDRIVSLGDTSWKDYEVRVPVTVHSIAAVDPNSPSVGPGIGLLLRWNGHNNTITPGSQPQQGFKPEAGSPTPFGALAFWNDPASAAPRLSMRNHRADEVAFSSFTLQAGTTYIMRAQVEVNTYRFKMWKASDPEPTGWMVQYTQGTKDRQPATGAVALLAHEVDATFGDVILTPWGTKKVARPTFSPKSGVLDSGDAVTVNGRDDAVIHYTTDGSDPSPLSPLAEFGIPITETGTIRAIQYRLGKRPSSIASATYFVNAAPVVSAGPDATINADKSYPLSGSATDDGLGSGPFLTQWTKVSGPGVVTFADSGAPATLVSFSIPGTYVLSLEADDGTIVRSDEVTIIVRLPGYWIVDTSGEVFGFGSVPLYGDLKATGLDSPVAAMAASPSQLG